MTLFSKLRSAQAVQMLCGATVTAGKKNGGRRPFAFVPAALDRTVPQSDYVLLAAHYYSNILGRYPRDESRTYQLSSDLHWMVHLIVERGVWPDSNLFDYAGVGDDVELVGRGDLEGQRVGVALIRPLLGVDLDVGVEIPAGMPDEDVNLSVIAMLQGILPMLDEKAMVLFDHVLRRIRLYHNEGADYSDPTAAPRLVNQAFRDAGGDGN
ncbi:MAG: hypothetical protein R6X13_03635 [bacterium]